MNSSIMSLLLLVLMASATIGQTITPVISARVDTNNAAIRDVCAVFVSYLNSRPDSAYQNPHWNPSEYAQYLKGDESRVDVSATFLFYALDSEQLYSIYQPFVLQVDSLEPNLYEIKTLLSTVPTVDQPQQEVLGITIHHARRDDAGIFKLQNYRSYYTRNWTRVRHEFIDYVIAPGIEFNRTEAAQAVSFCKSVADMFGLELLPFTYYVMSNTNELGRLFNFDYWIHGVTGLSNLDSREVYSSYRNLNYAHEFVHILFPLRSESFAPKIINEGIATWLAGPSHGMSFEQALDRVRKDLKRFDDVSFERIRNQEIRNSHDSNILYVTGAVLCKMAYEKGGKSAILRLWNADESTLHDVIESVFQQPYEKVCTDVMNTLNGSD
ncbi:MAG: hypothetical protein RL594_6 [Bacteroidota bacterium]